MASSCATINYLEEFLLNSGPKQDCLIHICEYIDVYDMVNLSESSNHPELFMEFFQERVSNLNSVDFTVVQETESFQKVIEHFGPFMRKIKMSLSSVPFELFMKNVIRYCVPGKLIELEIETGKQCWDIPLNFEKNPGYGWLEQARPILHRLEKLSLNNVAGQLEPIFKLYQRDLPNLKTLTLENFAFRTHNSIFKTHIFQLPTWTDIFPNELSNVTELHLCRVELRESVQELDLFLNQLTNLQVFVHICQINANLQPEVIADCLYRRFPQLRGIGFNVHGATFSIPNRFSFLQKFSNLTEIYVGGSFDQKPCDIRNIIQFVPDIKILSIADVFAMFQPPVAVRRIKQSIKEVIDRRRNRYPHKDRIQIIVDARQYRDFMAIKNVNEIIKLNVKCVDYKGALCNA